MYTRTYFSDENKVDIPENYDGTAFREKEDSFVKSEAQDAAPAQNPNASEETVSRSVFSPILEKLPLKGLGNFLPFLRPRDSSHEKREISFGTEEVLICIIALYMFFSKEGDKECAIMLIFLLFIT